LGDAEETLSELAQPVARLRGMLELEAYVFTRPAPGLIDVPGNATVTFRNANQFPLLPFAATIRSLVSNNALSIIGGSLTVTETMQVNNTFSLDGTLTDSDAATLNATVLRGTRGQGLTIGVLSGMRSVVSADAITELDPETAPMRLAISVVEARLRPTSSLTWRHRLNCSTRPTASSACP
jgi:hypothetical protein